MPEVFVLNSITDASTGDEYLRRDDIEAWLLNRAALSDDGSAAGKVAALTCEGLLYELRQSREQVTDGADGV